ncbi:MAG TPA: bacterial proteasome activator family protein [Angustibacter sp.]|nr:bacterial proteasome activator family protein [Angustibacter sp.]
MSDSDDRAQGTDDASQQADNGSSRDDQGRIVVVTPEGMGIAATPGGDEEELERNPAELVEQPAKVMRIGSMIKQLLDEVRSAPLDEAGRSRLAAIHERSLHELEQGLAPELVDELRRIALPFGEGETPSDAELRIAQAQLVGWLEGLFHGIQTALMAQQMAARAQLEEMRRALPAAGGGASGPSFPGRPQPGQPGMPGRPEQSEGPEHGTGQYL